MFSSPLPASHVESAGIRRLGFRDPAYTAPTRPPTNGVAGDNSLLIKVLRVPGKDRPPNTYLSGRAPLSSGGDAGIPLGRAIDWSRVRRRCPAKHPTDPCDATIRASVQFTLPNSCNSPPFTTETGRNPAVTRPVPIDLVPPRLRVPARGNVPSAVMAMPEAPVNEDHDPGRWPREVRPTEKRLVPAPPGQPRSPEERD